MDRAEFEVFAKDVMRRASMLTLATSGDEPYPLMRALFNLRNETAFPGLAAYQADKGISVFLGTNTSSIKTALMGTNAWVSVYYMIPEEFRGLNLTGMAVRDGDARKALWVEGWERYYPTGRDDPDYTVFRIDPVRARGWNCGAAFDLAL